MSSTELARVMRRAREDWLSVLLSTAETDEAQAEEGARRAYHAAGLPPPRAFLWARSPRNALAVAHTERRRRLDDEAFNLSYDEWAEWYRGMTDGARSALRELREWLMGRSRGTIDHIVWRSYSPLHHSIKRGKQNFYSTGENLYGRGFQCAPMLAQRATASRILSRPLPDVDAAKVTIARAGAMWWGLHRCVVFAPRPSRMVFDENGRLHSETGPAVEYDDGWWRLCAWHGTRISERALYAPDTIDAKGVLEDKYNSEGSRRTLLDRLGPERLLRGAPFTVAHADRNGILYQIDVPQDEPVMIAKVRCPSTGNEHLLRVPPTVRTCTAACAWTFGLEAEQYAPEVEA